MPLRRILLVLAALLLVAGGVYALYWFHVAGELRKGLDAWAAERRGAGWQVAWADAAVGGFPGRLTLRLDRPELARPDGVSWRTGGLVASASPFDLTRFRVLAAGRHHLEWGGRMLSAEAAALDGTIDLDRAGRIEALEIAAAGLVLSGAAEASAGTARLDLALTDPERADADTVTARFAVAAGQVELPQELAPVLDRQLARVELAGRVLGPVPPGAPEKALLGWSAAGGVVELDRLALDWAPLALDGDGTLALDPRGRPLAALSARVRGAGDLMDRLAQAGMMEVTAASAAKLVLSLMAKPDARGRPAVTVPVTVQDGALFLGPARLGDVPDPPWAKN